MTEPTINRCPDLMRSHQRTHGTTHRSMRDATGRFAQFEPEIDWDTRALKWICWALAVVIAAMAVF